MTTVLMVDGVLPCREASAGERATLDLIDGLRALGHEVDFTCLDSAGDDALRAEAMHRAGIRVLVEHGQGLAHLTDVVNRGYGVVIAHRPGPALAVQAALRGASAATVYMGHDIHQWRLEAQHRLLGGVPRSRLLAAQMAERRCWQDYDLTVYPTTREADYVQAMGRPALPMPYYRLTAVDLPALTDSRNRHGCLMVGTSSHAPNKDAVESAVTEALPLIAETITVVGDWPSNDRAPLMSASVTFTGRVDEGVLRDLHSSHLALLAPLRFGAGSRRKLVAAMGLGLPVITTSEGLRGLLVRDATTDDPVLVADTPAEVATHVRRLREEPAWATDLARRAQACIASVYGQTSYDASVAAALTSAMNGGR